jgi:prepilin-type N-terminal cleavage/methylation domain-containing protein
MKAQRNSRRRAFTLVEMMVAMAVMGIVMSFAALEFRAVVFTYLDADSHLSAEQQARVALAKVNDLSRQASVVNDVSANAPMPVPAIIEPASTAGPRLQFTKADSLDPNTMHLFNGAPEPCYDVVTITLSPVSISGDPIAQPHNLVAETAPYPFNPTDCPTPANDGLRLIARNVQDFTVQQVEPCIDTSKCSSFLQGYRIDISTFDYDDHASDEHAGALYHLSSVITPLTFGKSE